VVVPPRTAKNVGFASRGALRHHVFVDYAAGFASRSVSGLFPICLTPDMAMNLPEQHVAHGSTSHH
jgi:hypothetical protein